jgi:thioredoxin 1
MDPTREQIDVMPGATVLEFGASWCGWCQEARPLVDELLAAHPNIRHIWIEDGRGKRLGRSFGVKTWPTLVFLRDGREVARLVRPRGERELAAALQLVAA